VRHEAGASLRSFPACDAPNIQAEKLMTMEEKAGAVGLMRIVRPCVERDCRQRRDASPRKNDGGYAFCDLVPRLEPSSNYGP
jgi:hypothetical protein